MSRSKIPKPVCMADNATILDVGGSCVIFGVQMTTNDFDCRYFTFYLSAGIR